MTRQQMYEECLLRTFRRAADDYEHPMHDMMSNVGDVYSMTLNEIMMKMDLLGYRSIPRKEDFAKWGIPYICQVMGFVDSEDDSDFTRRFFSFLRRNRGLYRKPADRKALGDTCWAVFVERMTNNRDFCQELGNFMIFTFKGEEWFDDFLKVASTFALLHMDGMDEYQRIRYGKTLSEMVEDALAEAAGEEDDVR